MHAVRRVGSGTPGDLELERFPLRALALYTPARCVAPRHAPLASQGASTAQRSPRQLARAAIIIEEAALDELRELKKAMVGAPVRERAADLILSHAVVLAATDVHGVVRFVPGSTLHNRSPF